MFKNALIALVYTLILAAACTPAEQKSKLTIVTTTGILADCVKNIVGDQADVVALMGAGVDPHLYRASQGDIEKLTQADIVVYNGLHLEGKMAKMLENYKKTKPTYAVGSYIDHSLLKKVDQQSDLVDPHVWFGPELWLAGLAGLAKDLDKAEGISGCEKRCDAYKLAIQNTTDSLKAIINKELPYEQRRILITSHDAFEYFGDAFSFSVRGLQGISTAAEYGTKDVRQLTDYIIQNEIKAVFVETSVSNKNLAAVVESAKARGYDLQIGGTLYSDALGEKGTASGTYKGMLISNINTIIKGLK